MRRAAVLLCCALVFGVASGQEGQPQDPNQPPSEGAPPEQPAVPPEEAAPEESAPPEQPAPVQPPAPVKPAPAVPVTLGQFLVKVAAGLKLAAPEGGFTAESAAWALVLKGIRPRAELASPLTEADAVTVLTGLGYKIRSTTPSRVVTADRADLLIETFIPPGRS